MRIGGYIFMDTKNGKCVAGKMAVKEKDLSRVERLLQKFYDKVIRIYIHFHL